MSRLFNGCGSGRRRRDRLAPCACAVPDTGTVCIAQDDVFLTEDRSPAAQPAQCAALPYRLNEGRVEVLLVTPRGGVGWIIPKGKVEARLGVPRSAAREAEEEGGVRGEIARTAFDQYRHGGGADGPLVTVYLMRVTRELASWPESHQRERRWAVLDEVPRLVVDPGLARVMRAAADHLAIHAAADWPAAEEARRKMRTRRLGLAGSALLLAAVFAVAAAFLG
ncbi:MAG TPA: NUDIX hydrolase [Longimicrobium sp.]